MAEKLMVRPGEGRTVRLDGGKGRRLTADNAPAGGVAVERNTYINRRLDCGDLVIVEPAAAPAKNSAQPAIAADTKGA